MAAQPAQVLTALLALLLAGPGIAGTAERAGVAPSGPWACPDSHPIKGYASATAGHRVYFVPGHRDYDEASPERCYATESEAHRDGGVPARIPPPVRPPSDELG